MTNPNKRKPISNIGRSGSKNLSDRLSKPILAWAFYDWANSAFATTVIAGFFPLFFKEFWSFGVSPSESTYKLGIANSIASFVLAISAPALGALADKAQSKKKFLFFFCLLGSLMTSGLYFSQKGQWEMAIFFYLFASLGFAGGNIFYDALITLVAKKKELDFVSGLGFSLGYLGGGLLFAINVLMTLKPQLFNLTSSAQAVQISFLLVAIWWLIFSIPLFLFVKETERSKKVSFIKLFMNSLQQLKSTFTKLKQQRALFLFLLAYLFYIDGVNTIIKMAVDYGLALGFESSHLITALLITQFVGFPSAIAFGFIGERFGARTGIYIALASYSAITIFGYFMDSSIEFYYLAFSIGLVQGGIQSLSRSHYAKMLPVGQEAEYFGFFNMVGKFSAILGPFLVGWVSLKTQSPRLSILVILIFFIIGGGFLHLHSRFIKNNSISI